MSNKSNFSLLLISGAISYCGTAISILSNSYLYSQHTTNTESFSLFFLLGILPAIIFKKPIEIAIKKLKPFTVLRGSEFLRFILTLFFGIAVISNYYTSSLALSYIFILATLNIIFLTFYFKLLPSLLSEDQRIKLFSYGSSLSQLGFFVGLFLFKLMLGKINIGYLFCIDAFTYLVSFSIFSKISKNKNLQHVNITKIDLDNHSGFKLKSLLNMRILFIVALCSLPFAMLQAFNIILPILALKLNAWGPKSMASIDQYCITGVIIFGLIYPHFSKKINIQIRGLLLSLLITILFLWIANINILEIHFIYFLSFFYGILYSLTSTLARNNLYNVLFDKYLPLDGRILAVNFMESCISISISILLPVISGNNIFVSVFWGLPIFLLLLSYGKFNSTLKID